MRKVKSITCDSINRLLIVGPCPPPVGGGTVNFQVLLNELAKYTTIQTIAINTSPRSYRKKTSLFKLEKINRLSQITRQYIMNIKYSHAVLVIGTHSFIFTTGSFLHVLARLYGVPFYVKPLGAEIFQRFNSHKKLIRRYIVIALRAATGVMFQTRQLQEKFAKLGLTNTHYVPGYRPAPSNSSASKQSSVKLRLVFLSHIMREKGPLLLLEALRILAPDKSVTVECDFYGPIFEEDRKEFLKQLDNTTGAEYCGVAEIGKISPLMTRYDALVFPTYCSSEGHPGVIIEAMHAGITVISTQYPAVSELITHEENGILVPVGNSRALASEIKRLAIDHTLREKLSKANHKMSEEFRSDLVVSQMLEIILPGFTNNTSI